MIFFNLFTILCLGLLIGNELPSPSSSTPSCSNWIPVREPRLSVSLRGF